jgi:hypothetical protein
MAKMPDNPELQLLVVEASEINAKIAMLERERARYFLQQVFAQFREDLSREKRTMSTWISLH